MSGAGAARGVVGGSAGRRRAARRALAGSGGGGERGPTGEDGEADEVVGGRDQVAGHPGALQAPAARAPEAADGLHPAEDLLDPGPDALTHGVAGVAGRPAVDRAGAVGRVLRDVRGDLPPAHVGHEVGGVVLLVGPDRPGWKPRSRAWSSMTGAA